MDKGKFPGLQQKRILAFVNHFVLDTCDFLNKFVNDCDFKFVAFENKLRRVEDALLILEAKLDSIPDLGSQAPLPGPVLDVSPPTNEIPPANNDPATRATSEASNVEVKPPEPAIIEDEVDQPLDTAGVKISEDYRYRKYFKMISFGVPPPAAKIKMASEGLDPDLLDDPNKILSDGRRTPPAQSSSDEDDDSSS